MKVKISDYAKMHGVTYRTVWNWIKNGEVVITKNAHGRNFIELGEKCQEKNVGIYCRVSSSENKNNLEKQKQRMVDYCAAKGYQIQKIVCEIGSGLNDGRPKLESLLLDKQINVIVAEHSDRISRFGMNYIEKLLASQGRKIEIVNQAETEKEDLVQDFVAIITSFTARLYGQRRNKRKTEKLIKELANETC